MPVTYLKGAGAVIGRDVEAFQAQRDAALHAASSAHRCYIRCHACVRFPVVHLLVQGDACVSPCREHIAGRPTAQVTHCQLAILSSYGQSIP